MHTLLQLIGWLLLLLLAVFVFWQTGLRVIRRYVHFPAPAFITVLLNSPLRKAIQPPAQVVGWMNIHEGMTVLEIGPGGRRVHCQALVR